MVDNLCNCHDCARSFKHVLSSLRINEFKYDLKHYCSCCSSSETCPTATLLNDYLKEIFPNFEFSIEDLFELPLKYRDGICNYIHEKMYFED